MRKRGSSHKQLGKRRANSGLHLGMKHSSSKKSKKKYHKGKAY